MAAALSFRARSSKSTGQALAGAGIQVPSTIPRSITWSGRVLTVRNSFVNRLVLICVVIMSDKQWQTIATMSNCRKPGRRICRNRHWMGGGWDESATGRNAEAEERR